MAAASFDEIKFFVDDRDDIAQRICATGATTTQVMAAIGAHEQHLDASTAPAPIRDVVSILDEEEAIEIEVDDIIE